MPFDAFISYAHGKDERLAKALQDGLHRLAKRWDSLSAIRVFRDATHLPLASLQPAIVQALGESTFLIVLASPESTKSKWVQKELACFLETHPAERVLLVLTSGTLDWDETAHRFRDDSTSAFPAETLAYAKEPLFLDLRWAADDPDLSLSNPRFLDAVATLAATLQAIPKETLVGDLVEEQRRLRRNQRLNLGFRGAIGFGASAAVLFVLASVYSFTSAAVLSSGHLLLLIGFPAIGAIGALCCGLEWRAVLGFALGFLVLLPFYFIGSLQPVRFSIADQILLASFSLAGFVFAGTLGVIGSRALRSIEGAGTFFIGGVVAAVLWLMPFQSRSEGLHTDIAAVPWFMERLWLAGRRAFEFAGEMLSDRTTTSLVPLIAAVTVAGALLGVRLADARFSVSGKKPIPTPKKPRSRRLRLVLFGVVCIGLLVWACTFTDRYERALARNELRATRLRERLTGSSNYPGALAVMLQARNAFERAGDRAEADAISRLVDATLQTFTQSPDQFYDRLGGHIDRLAEVAHVLKESGRPAERARLIHLLREHSRNATPLAGIAAARAQNMLGARNAAIEALAQVKPTDLYEKSLFATALVETGDTERARKVIGEVGDREAPDTLIGLFGEIAPASGDALSRVWSELPKWRTELDNDVVVSVIASMCRRGETELAVRTAREKRSSLRSSAGVLGRAAAEARHDQTAFAIVDALAPAGNLDASDERAAALAEIVAAARAQGNRSALQRGITELRAMEPRARESEPVTFATAFAHAGEFPAALRMAEAIPPDDQWKAHLAIGMELTSAGHRSEAAPLLASGWRGLHANWGSSSSVPHSELADIGISLAKIGEFRAARRVATDIGSDFERRYEGDLEQLAQLSIHAAILDRATPR